MNTRKYLILRRSYYSLSKRFDFGPGRQLTFEELCLLSYLKCGESFSAAHLAEYQSISPPTFTHRGDKLVSLGLVFRKPDLNDRRRMLVSLTPKGNEFLDAFYDEMLCEMSHHLNLDEGFNQEDLCHVLCCVGVADFKAADIVLMALHELDRPAAISEIVEMTGLLQPTVSMSAQNLEARGFLTRKKAAHNRRVSSLALTAQGKQVCIDYDCRVTALPKEYREYALVN